MARIKSFADIDDRSSGLRKIPESVHSKNSLPPLPATPQQPVVRTRLPEQFEEELFQKPLDIGVLDPVMNHFQKPTHGDLQALKKNIESNFNILTMPMGFSPDDPLNPVNARNDPSSLIQTIKDQQKDIEKLKVQLVDKQNIFDQKVQKLQGKIDE